MNLVLKTSLPKLSKQTIQDSIQRLFQIVHINHCIESQIGNYGSLTMHITLKLKNTHILKQTCVADISVTMTYIPRKMLTNDNNECSVGNRIYEFLLTKATTT